YLSAIGGGPTRSWRVAQGSLPDRIALNPVTGELSGRPTSAESQTFTVEVTSNGLIATKALTMTVSDPNAPLTIVTRVLPPAIGGREYDHQIVIAGGGGAGAMFSATGLPPGLAIDASGLISGIATTPGSSIVSVSADDGASIATREYDLTVDANANVSIVPA